MRIKMSRNNIILCGFMGSGKTTIGKLIAEFLKMDFIDTDDDICLKLNIFLVLICFFIEFFLASFFIFLIADFLSFGLAFIF